MISDLETATADELIRALQVFASQFPSLDPAECTEWDTQEWYDEDIERYAELVGEVLDRIDCGEMKPSDLDLKEARRQGIDAGNFDEAMVVMADDDTRSYGPSR